MRRIFLCLLCLSGWIVTSCLQRQYHHVNDPMTWTEAQTYCREKYTDLATVENEEEKNQLRSTVPNDRANEFFWIGLYSKIQWKWSDGYKGSGSDYRGFIPDRVEPNFDGGQQFCVCFSKLGWKDLECTETRASICYRGRTQESDFVYVKTQMSWFDAQKHCREKHSDLATVKSSEEDKMIKNLAIGDESVWLGLYRDPDLYWSDGSGSSFQFWSLGTNPLISDVVCGAVYQQKQWGHLLKSCDTRYPFACYSSGSKHVIKLKMKSNNPHVNLNDPAVKAELLRQLQEQLKESGLSGVTLRWREQPDGKVFHRESSKEKDREMCEL